MYFLKINILPKYDANFLNMLFIPLYEIFTSQKNIILLKDKDFIYKKNIVYWNILILYLPKWGPNIFDI